MPTEPAGEPNNVVAPMSLYPRACWCLVWGQEVKWGRQQKMRDLFTYKWLCSSADRVVQSGKRLKEGASAGRRLPTTRRGELLRWAGSVLEKNYTCNYNWDIIINFGPYIHSTPIRWDVASHLFWIYNLHTTSPCAQIWKRTPEQSRFISLHTSLDLYQPTINCLLQQPNYIQSRLLSTSNKPFLLHT
jgi:hypothetical protein